MAASVRSRTRINCANFKFWPLLLILYFIIFFSSAAAENEIKLCPLAVEEQPYQLQCFCSDKIKCETGIIWSPSNFSTNIFCQCTQPPPTCRCTGDNNLSATLTESDTGWKTVLTISNPSRNKLWGTWKCESGGNILLSCHFTVNVVPKVLSFNMSSNASSGSVQENTLVTFTCEAEGNPRPRLSLQKRGTSETMSTSTDATLHVNKTMTCKDTGVYLCKADQVTSPVEILVPCAQQLLKPEEQDQVYEGYVGKNLPISISVYGYPEPTSFNLSSERAIPNTNTYNINYVSTEVPYGVVLIQFYKLEESYFQNYTLNVTNTQGSLVYTFSIKKTDSEPEIGAILGGIIAGLVVLILIAGLIFIIRRKNGKQMQNSNTDIQISYYARLINILQQTNDAGTSDEDVPPVSQYDEVSAVELTAEEKRKLYQHVLPETEYELSVVLHKTDTTKKSYKNIPPGSEYETSVVLHKTDITKKSYENIPLGSEYETSVVLHKTDTTKTSYENIPPVSEYETSVVLHKTDTTNMSYENIPPGSEYETSVVLHKTDTTKKSYKNIPPGSGYETPDVPLKTDTTKKTIENITSGSEYEIPVVLHKTDTTKKKNENIPPDSEYEIPNTKRTSNENFLAAPEKIDMDLNSTDMNDPKFLYENTL